MPTGFSRVRNDNDYGCDFGYKNNAAYCNYYDRQINDNGYCTYTWWDKGMSFIDTLKSAVRQLDSTEMYRSLPKNLPEKPQELQYQHTVQGWREYVDKNFKLPQIVEIAS